MIMTFQSTKKPRFAFKPKCSFFEKIQAFCLFGVSSGINLVNEWLYISKSIEICCTWKYSYQQLQLSTKRKTMLLQSSKKPEFQPSFSIKHQFTKQRDYTKHYFLYLKNLPLESIRLELFDIYGLIWSCESENFSGIKKKWKFLVLENIRVTRCSFHLNEKQWHFNLLRNLNSQVFP